MPMTSKAGMNGLVSLSRPETIPSASPERTSSAPKKWRWRARSAASSGVAPLARRSSR